MRATYVIRDGVLVEKATTPPLARSSLPAPMIISDTTDPFFSHADGKMYESKSRYYRTLKERGLRIVEEPLGRPEPKYADDPITADEVGAAYRKVRDGYKPALESEEII